MTVRNSPGDLGVKCVARGCECVTCGETLHGPYCAACGERVIEPDDARFATFVRETASDVFSADSRLWRSLRALVVQPGLLTAEYARGRRRPYLNPLQVFLIANLVFFAAFNTLAGTNVFTTELHYHITQPVYGPIAEGMVAKYGQHGTAMHEDYTRRFDEATAQFASSMVILMAPLLALVLWLAYGGRRRYLHHLVTSLHLFAFILLAMALLPAVAMILYRIAPVPVQILDDDLVLTMLITLGLWSYFAASLRRAYDDRAAAAIIRGFVLSIAMFPVITIYRTVLFFAVYYSLSA